MKRGSHFLLVIMPSQDGSVPLILVRLRTPLSAHTNQLLEYSRTTRMKNSLYISSVLAMVATLFPITVLAEAHNSAKIPEVHSKWQSNNNDKRVQRTSTDLYCETMTISLFEQVFGSKPPKSDAQAEKIKNAEQETLKTCKSMPTVGGKEKSLKEMTPKELSQLNCLAVADGISTAHYTQNEDHLLYAELSRKRQFFMDACASNSKQLLADLKKYGPYHVLKKQY